MTPYRDAREFTDRIHNDLAIPMIYSDLSWKKVEIGKEDLKELDIRNGIDYIFTDGKNRISIQERFRKPGYTAFDDFTLRYEREFNPHENRRKSEFFKIKADYFVYGMVNENHDDFSKYVVVDLKKLLALFDEGRIIVDNSVTEGVIEGGNLKCPIKHNRDRSSTFVAIRIPLIDELFDNLIILQKGFL